MKLLIEQMSTWWTLMKISSSQEPGNQGIQFPFGLQADSLGFASLDTC